MAINELEKLLQTEKNWEVSYPRWSSNVGVVKKLYRKWRACIDLTGLNKACPRAPFPLHHINAMVDVISGHKLLSFLDAFSSYNNILLEPSD